MDAEVAHRRALEGLRGQTVVGREAERADIGGHVGDATCRVEQTRWNGTD